jgi:hypothetical protein
VLAHIGLMDLHDTFHSGWGVEANMQGLLRLLRAGFAHYAIRRRNHMARSADVTVPGQPAEPGVTILSYDSFR